MVPFLKLKNQFHLDELLNKVEIIPLFVDWQKIINYQTVALRNGINKIGLPDLIILDNVIQNNLTLYTLDKHFQLLKRHIHLELI